MRGPSCPRTQDGTAAAESSRRFWTATCRGGAPMSSVAKRSDGQWRARYRDSSGKEHARHFARKVDAQRWLDETTTAVLTGTYVDPKTARTTVEAWCTTWLEGYATRRPSTVRQARVHVAHIVAAFGPMPLAAVRPSH